jgi:xanthine/uracil permease
MYSAQNTGMLAATGVAAWASGLGILGVVCVVIGMFAILQASGAVWRVVPARWRRSWRK